MESSQSFTCCIELYRHPVVSELPGIEPTFFSQDTVEVILDSIILPMLQVHKMYPFCLFRFLGPHCIPILHIYNLYTTNMLGIQKCICILPTSHLNNTLRII